MNRMLNTDRKNSADAGDNDQEYFTTPNTGFDQQRQVSSFDAFDVSNDLYKKSTSRTVVKKYVIK